MALAATRFGNDAFPPPPRQFNFVAAKGRFGGEPTFTVNRSEWRFRIKIVYRNSTTLREIRPAAEYVDFQPTILARRWLK